MDSRSAFAAACRRSLTSVSSFAARSMRSCCVSARSLIVLSCFAISSTARVRSASWPAIAAVSSSCFVISRFTGSYGGEWFARYRKPDAWIAPEACSAASSSEKGAFRRQAGELSPREASPSKVAKHGQHKNDDDDDPKNRHVILSFGSVATGADTHL